MTTEQNANSSIPDLKAARQNSGLTLKEMFERTRISVVNLEAMENGRFHLLPVPIYTRNFIKTYAAALGVDSKPVLQRYEDYLQALKNKEREQAAVKPPRAPLAETLGRHKIVLWAASIVILVAAASIFATVYNKTPTEARLAIESSGDAASGAAPVQSTPEQAFTVGIDPALPAPFAPSPAIRETAASKEAPEKNKTAATDAAGDEEVFPLIINATEQTWIRMQADDKEPYEVLLNAGEKITQKASRFNMDIGNAGGVRIQFDGKTIENLGKSGQVIHLRLP